MPIVLATAPDREFEVEAEAEAEADAEAEAAALEAPVAIDEAAAEL